MEERKVIFISHATPEDNEFAIWLALKLQNLGYEVWLDKRELLGGEKTWDEITKVINDRAIKFVLVYSSNICKASNELKDGIQREYKLAEDCVREVGLNDFIILVKIDNSGHNLFPGSGDINQIFFYPNWADGLRQLIEKIEKDNVPKSDSPLLTGEWYESTYLTECRIKQKKELYYSNWWKIERHPDRFYSYKFETELEAELIFGVNKTYPACRMGNLIFTFDPDITLEIIQDGAKYSPKLKEKEEIVISKLTDLKDSKNDTNKHLIALLRKIFHQIMKNRKMFWCEMANRRLAYYYTVANLKTTKVRFEYPFRPKQRPKTKSLIGDYLSLGKWHYAVSCRPILYPVLAFSLASHIVFTSDGIKVWEDKDKMHSHRRSKGKRFFNEEWRDLIFAFINGLKQLNTIKVLVAKDLSIEMDTMPDAYWADFGYDEPRDALRLEVLSQDEEPAEEGQATEDLKEEDLSE